MDWTFLGLVAVVVAGLLILLAGFIWLAVLWWKCATLLQHRAVFWGVGVTAFWSLFFPLLLAPLNFLVVAWVVYHVSKIRLGARRERPSETPTAPSLPPPRPPGPVVWDLEEFKLHCQPDVKPPHL